MQFQQTTLSLTKTATATTVMFTHPAVQNTQQQRIDSILQLEGLAFGRLNRFSIKLKVNVRLRNIVKCIYAHEHIPARKATLFLFVRY